MTGITNAVYRAPFAYIEVTYPEGSECTCSKGGTVLQAKDTSGTATFMVPSGGTWTVTATNGEKTASKTVEVEQNGMHSVQLKYELILFPNENASSEFSFYTGAAGRYAVYSDRIYLYTSGTNGQRSAAFYKTQFAPGEYSKIKCHVVISGAQGIESYVGAAKSLTGPTDPLGNGTMIARSGSKSNGTFDWEIDISKVTVPFYVTATMAAANMSVYILWLE